MRSKNELIASVLKGRRLLANPRRTGNDRKAVKGNINDWLQQLRDGRFLPEDTHVKAVWMRNTYFVQAVQFDYQLYKFEVLNFNCELIGTIYPDDLDAMVDIEGDLDGGADVDGWEDGQGGEIKIPESK